MRRPDLVPDCGSCAAICCVATSFDASDDFGFDKPAGVGCRYLRRDCRCAIHEQLVERGFRGCALYDCYGAGQRATRAFSGGRLRHEAFRILRVVHELLWLLTEAAKLCPRGLDGPRLVQEIEAEIEAEIDALDAVARGPGGAVLEIDLQSHEAAVRALLHRVGAALGGRRRAARALVVLR